MSKQKQSPDEDGTMSDRMRESDLEMLRWFNENYGYDANAADRKSTRLNSSH